MNEPIKIEKLFHERLWVIQALTNESATVDAWETAVRAYIQRFGSAPERYLVYDLQPIEKLSFTPYMRQRATVLAQDNREATGRVAVVVNYNPLQRYIFDQFIYFIGTRLQPHLSVKLFGDRMEAINWVAHILPVEFKRGGEG